MNWEYVIKSLGREPQIGDWYAERDAPVYQFESAEHIEEIREEADGAGIEGVWPTMKEAQAYYATLSQNSITERVHKLKRRGQL